MLTLDGHPLLRTRCYVDGAWVDAPAHVPVVDPASGERIAEVPALDDAAVDAACEAAARAFPGWRDRPAADRGGALASLGARMHAEERELAALITAENGKPHVEAIAEVRYAASFIDWFAGEALRIYGETVPAPRADQRIVVLREPVGPCALITPWNFPAAMLTRKIGAALAAGCTVVAKPAEQTPLTALALAQLAEDAGVPAGVLNVITGEPTRVGPRLCGHRAIRKISFTGSTEIGRLIARNAAGDLKRVSLELGGNAPFLVFDDADLDLALGGAMVAKYRGGGQTCVAANRFLLAREIHDEFARRVVDASGQVTIGPLIDDEAVAKVRRLVEGALAGGARLLCGAVPTTRKAAPVVLAGVTPAMAIWHEEIFGPVIMLTPFDGEADAIAKANDTDAGLVAYVFTRDLRRAERVARALEVGMVGVNEGLVSYAHAPFGGVKQSGYGREGGRAGIDDYVHLKYVMTSLR